MEESYRCCSWEERNVFDVLFVCLWLMVMISFSHQPLLNLEKEI